MHLNFLEPDQDLQDQLDYAEVELCQMGFDLVPVSSFKMRAREFYYKSYIFHEFSGLGADYYVFYLSEAYQYLQIILGDEHVLALDCVSVMSKPRGRRELKCVSVETLELVDFFLRLDVSIC